MDNLQNSNHYFTFLWIFALSTLGSIVAYIKKKRESKEPFNWMHLSGDILISFFLGVITYFLCKGANLSEFWTAGFVGIVSHLGTRVLILFDTLIPVFQDMIKFIVPKIVCKWLNIDCKDDIKRDDKDV